MTVDFRPPEERGELPAEPRPTAVQRGRRLVQAFLAGAAVLMVAAGVAIWVTAPSFLSPDTVPLVAMALVLSGVFDALMAWGFGHWWLAKKQA